MVVGKLFVAPSTVVLVLDRKQGDRQRGTVWKVKHREADGCQVKETLGHERDGWTRRKAEAELRERLVRVERKGYRRPKPLTFGEYAERWFAEGEAKRGWKPRTAAQYCTVERWLVDYFGSYKLAEIRPRHLAAYVAQASQDLGAASVGRDLAVLSAIFVSAVREDRRGVRFAAPPQRRTSQSPAWSGESRRGVPLGCVFLEAARRE